MAEFSIVLTLHVPVPISPKTEETDRKEINWNELIVIWWDNARWRVSPFASLSRRLEQRESRGKWESPTIIPRRVLRVFPEREMANKLPLQRAVSIAAVLRRLLCNRRNYTEEEGEPIGFCANFWKHRNISWELTNNRNFDFRPDARCETRRNQAKYHKTDGQLTTIHILSRNLFSYFYEVIVAKSSICLSDMCLWTSAETYSNFL